ncbi:protein atonal-like 8 [Silurus meridionalis]|nr:protein atonal-like 8 [Silurus meridionalis]
MDRCNPTDGYKKYKRKVRDSVKHGEKLSPHSKTSIDSMGPLLKEVCGKTRDKKLEHFDTAEDYRQQPDILNTALDMKMYTLPSQITNETETPLWSVSETAFKSRNDSASLQVSVFNNQQAIPTNCHPQSRILLCKRSERALCSTSLGSYLHNSLDHTDSLRKRSEEQTVGVVTEIKAIQQTRRLLANARERTRVHTISAAFEALRKQRYTNNMAVIREELVPKKGTVSSVIWNWFGFAASDAAHTPRCKVCLKAVASKGSSTTNLLQHLKQRHAVEWKRCRALRNEQDSGSTRLWLSSRILKIHG